VAVTSTRDPTKVNWGDFGADYICESTGKFTDKEKCSVHI